MARPKLPSSQNSTTREARGSARKTRKLLNAEKAWAMAMPAGTSRSGLTRPWCWATAKTTTMAASAPSNAAPDNAYSPAAPSEPNSSTAVAPTEAPEDTPSTYGSASGLRTSAWMVTSAAVRPAPATAASSTRGRRSCHTAVHPAAGNERLPAQVSGDHLPHRGRRDRH